MRSGMEWSGCPPLVHFCGLGGQPPGLAEPREGGGMPVLPVNGATLHYEDTGGPGEPIRFLHGFLFDARL